MRVWEFGRYDWEHFDDAISARDVPAALDALSSASTVDEAYAAYWEVDNVVVIQGSPREAAPATAACVVALLPICSPVARRRLIELLEQLSHDDPATPGDLWGRIVNEAIKGYAFYVALLEHGDDLESSMCIDLLFCCAKHDPDLRPRTAYYIRRLVEDDRRPKSLRTYAAARLQFESGTVHGTP